MTREDIQTAVLTALGKIAPEADLSQIDPGMRLQEQLDIDSMDFLNLVIALHKQFGIDIPEREYPKLTTLKGCVDFIKVAMGPRG